MKIGLISINAHTKVLNFASPLHTYVFQQFLENNGIDTTIIDYKPVYYGRFDVRHPLFYYAEHPESDTKVQNRLLKKWTRMFYERERRFDRIEEFIQKYYKKTDQCYNAKILEDTDLGFDCYICVTDVIWKYNPKNGFDRGYFLACKSMDGKKKIAYAASRGAKGYTAEQEKTFIEYTSDFDYISVREKSLQEYMHASAGLEVPHVIDPVFLCGRAFYDNLAIDPEEEHYVLLYVVMENAEQLTKDAVEFAKRKQLKLVIMGEDIKDKNVPDDLPHRFVYGTGVEEWLGYMRNADYVFTNSFHSSCFSIIFHKQFFVGARSGDKIDSLLDMFDLSWRRISKADNGKAQDMKPLVFDEVDKKREQYVAESTAFILDAIKEVEQRQHKPLIPDTSALQQKCDEKIAELQKVEAEEKVKKEETQKGTETEAEPTPSFFEKVKRKLKK